MAGSRLIITVVGKDQVGIIAKVCTYLSDNNINILDISQTIVSDFFNMMMIVDIKAKDDDFLRISDELIALGRSIGVEIKLQREEIFSLMQRV